MGNRAGGAFAFIISSLIYFIGSFDEPRRPRRVKNVRGSYTKHARLVDDIIIIIHKTHKRTTLCRRTVATRRRGISVYTYV